MPQFGATIKHIQEGVKGFTIAAAIKNIEGWEKTLGEMEEPSVKNVLKDLGGLKKLLEADEIDGEKVRKAVTKLGKDTVAMAGKTESKKADQIRELGEALSAMAEEAGEDEGEDAADEDDGKKAASKSKAKEKA